MSIITVLFVILSLSSGIIRFELSLFSQTEFSPLSILLWLVKDDFSLLVEDILFFYFKSKIKF